MKNNLIILLILSTLLIHPKEIIEPKGTDTLLKFNVKSIEVFKEL